MQIVKVQARHFPRAGLKVRKQEPVSISQRLEEAQAQKEAMQREMEEEQIRKQMEENLRKDEGFGLDEERVHDSMRAEYGPYALLTLPIDRVPEDLQKRMAKVLGKHSPFEVREWSRKLMQTYQLLHAVEKPMNLLYAKPFSNTSDLKNMTPKIHVDLADKRRELEHEENF